MQHPSIRPYRFVRKVIEVEAMLFDGSTMSQIAIKKWAGDAVTATLVDGETGIRCDNPHLHADLLIGRIDAEPGDWIVRNRGSFFPIRPDIFDETYSPIDPMPGIHVVD